MLSLTNKIAKLFTTLTSAVQETRNIEFGFCSPPDHVTLTLSPQINCRLQHFSSASIFIVLQCRSKLVKMLSECQTA